MNNNLHKIKYLNLIINYLKKDMLSIYEGRLYDIIHDNNMKGCELNVGML
jgi:hypothetical protein